MSQSFILFQKQLQTSQHVWAQVFSVWTFPSCRSSFHSFCRTFFTTAAFLAHTETRSEIIRFQINNITQDTCRRARGGEGLCHCPSGWWTNLRGTNAADLNHFKCKCLWCGVMQMQIEGERDWKSFLFCWPMCVTLWVGLLCWNGKSLPPKMKLHW